MRTLIPVSLTPINLFSIMGTPCCKNMHNEYSNFKILKGSFCFQSNQLVEANLIFLLGSFSAPLLKLINNHLTNNNSKLYCVHLAGCSHRVDNKISTHRLEENFKIHQKFLKCRLSEDELTFTLAEAKRCLRA